jgi:hypothetical protein
MKPDVIEYLNLGIQLSQVQFQVEFRAMCVSVPDVT